MEFKKSQWKGLIRELEAEGCFVEQIEREGDRSEVLRISVPGFERSFTLPAHSASAMIQRLFWNQLELRWDGMNERVVSRWIYWTWASLLQHVLACTIVLTCTLGRRDLKECLIMLLLANLVPPAVAFFEIRKIAELTAGIDDRRSERDDA